MKNFAEIYLPAEQLLINQLFTLIHELIKEKKKIPYQNSEKNPKEEYLEYFIISDSLISFHRPGGAKTKWSVTSKQLKDAIKYALRTDEELTKKGFNKMYGNANFVGSSLYLFVNLVIDEITNRRVVGQELFHQSFGNGIIAKMELDKNFIWFNYNDESKLLSMEYILLQLEDEQKINDKITSVLEVTNNESDN